jgi:hypothetical protein
MPNRAARRSAGAAGSYQRQLEVDNARLQAEVDGLRELVRAGDFYAAITAGRGGQAPRITWRGVGAELEAGWTMDAAEVAALQRRTASEAVDRLREHLDLHLGAFHRASMALSGALAAAAQIAGISAVLPSLARQAAGAMAGELAAASVDCDAASMELIGHGLDDDIRAGLLAVGEGLAALRTGQDDGERLRLVWQRIGSDGARQMIGALAEAARPGQPRQPHTVYMRAGLAALPYDPKRTNMQAAQLVIEQARADSEDPAAAELLSHWTYLGPARQKQWVTELLKQSRKTARRRSA